MYKVILAEDEEIFRKVLPEIIDWNGLGFDIVTVVDNGRKALEFLKTERADVILTDIRMPVLNGLELAMEVKNRYPMTRVILLSAFNEFDYARKGIDCGVYGYILKSEGEEEIERYFRNLKKVLDSEFTFENGDLWAQRELFLQCIMKEENVLLPQIMEIASKSRLPVSYENCIVSTFALDERQYADYLYGTEHIEKLLLRIRNYLAFRIELMHMGHVLASGSSVYVIWEMEKPKVMQELNALFAELLSELQLYDKGEEPGVTFTFGVGLPGSGFAGLQHSFRKAADAVLQRIYLGGGCIIDSGETAGNGGLNCNLPDENKVAGQILTFIHEGDTSKVTEYLESIYNCYQQCRLMDMSIINNLSIQVILAVMDDIAKMRTEANEEILSKSTGLLKTIGFCNTIRCALRQLELFLAEVMALLSSDNVIQNSKIIDEALRYIQSNYSHQITLEDVALHVNVHPIYLSRLFKRDVKKTFKAVLTEFRMEKAKKLLVELEYKVYEISELVGYEKPRYFSELFKTLTGLTPLEYRERYKI